MAMSLGEKIKLLASTKGVNNAEIARATGYTRSAVTKWFSGESEPKAGVLPKLAELFDVPEAYFFEDDQIIEMVSRHGSEAADALTGKGQAEEYLEKAADDGMLYEVAAGPGRINTAPEEHHGEGQLARVVGDSMYPSLHDGDIVRFVEAADVSPEEFALVRIDGEDMTVKHVEWTAEGLWIRAENKDVFPDRLYSVKEIATIPVQIVGKAVSFERRL